MRPAANRDWLEFRALCETSCLYPVCRVIQVPAGGETADATKPRLALLHYVGGQDYKQRLVMRHADPPHYNFLAFLHVDARVHG